MIRLYNQDMEQLLKNNDLPADNPPLKLRKLDPWLHSNLYAYKPFAPNSFIWPYQEHFESMAPDLKLKSITFTTCDTNFIDSIQLTYSDGSVSPLFKTNSNQYNTRHEIRLDNTAQIKRVSN